MENINDNIEQNKTADERLEELWNRLTQQYWDYDWDWYSYQLEYAEKKENWDYNLESQKIYKAEMMWEVFDIWLDTPEQMINILKLTDYILTLYMKEWYNINDWDNFYAKEWFMSWKEWVWKKMDLYINNRPTDILDTTYLSQEKLQSILIDKWEDFTNTFMEEYALFLNKIIEKKDTRITKSVTSYYKTWDKNTYTEVGSTNYKAWDKPIETNDLSK